MVNPDFSRTLYHLERQKNITVTLKIFAKVDELFPLKRMWQFVAVHRSYNKIPLLITKKVYAIMKDGYYYGS